MTNDGARQYFAACGLDYSVLTKENINRLWKILSIKLKESDCIKGTFRMRRGYKTWKRQSAFDCVELTCKADYFDRREAITFNSDGFIGFAGWASTVNVEPIIAGFVQWCDELKKVNGGGND